MKNKIFILCIFFALVSLVYYNLDGEEIEPQVMTVSAMEQQVHACRADMPKEASVFYYVTGAVAEPGLYETDREKPVGAIVSMAGGLLPYGDGAAVNGARVAPSGTHVHIPFSYDGDAAELLRTKRLNINTADEKELQTLSGVGPATAKRIIAYRNEKGLFATEADIMKVKGIGKGIYNKIKKQIRVN